MWTRYGAVIMCTRFGSGSRGAQTLRPAFNAAALCYHNLQVRFNFFQSQNRSLCERKRLDAIYSLLSYHPSHFARHDDYLQLALYSSGAKYPACCNDSWKLEDKKSSVCLNGDQCRNLNVRSESKTMDDDLQDTVTHSQSNVSRISSSSDVEYDSNFCVDSTQSFNQKDPSKISKELNEMRVQKKIMLYMSSWRIEDAISVLKTSVADGVLPDRTILLNMLIQIAKLGEVDRLLALHGLLQENKLVSDDNFYFCLCLAICNSGQVKEGIMMLTERFKTGLIDFEDIDVIFTVIGTMIVKQFNHHYSVLEEFVETLLMTDPPVLSARAWLWKCFVLAEKFDKADRLLEEHTDVKKMVPAQVTSIVHFSLPLDYDKDRVLLWMINLPYVKDGLKAHVFHLLIINKCERHRWTEAIDCIKRAMDDSFQLHHETMPFFLTRFLGELSDDQLDSVEKKLNHLQSSNGKKDDTDLKTPHGENVIGKV